MYSISDKTKMNIERVIGLSLEELANMDIDEERSWIENKNKTKLTFSKRRKYGVIGRGNPLLARRKIRTKEDLEKKCKKLFGI